MPTDDLKYHAVLLHEEAYEQIREQEIHQGTFDESKLKVDLTIPCPNCLSPANTFYKVEAEGPDVYAARDEPPPAYACTSCANLEKGADAEPHTKED